MCWRNREATVGERGRGLRHFVVTGSLVTASLAVILYWSWSARPHRADHEGMSHFEARHPITVKLADRLVSARNEQTLVRIGFDRPEEKALLTSGWNALQRTPEGEGYCWAKGRSAVIDLPIVRPDDLVIRFDLQAAKRTLTKKKRYRQGSQQLRVLWNGKEVANLVVPEKRFQAEVKIDRQIQRVGLNRLELMPAWWLRDSGIFGKSSIAFWSIDFKGQGRPGMSRRLPGISSGNSIIQDSESVITFGLIVPKGGALQGDVFINGFDLQGEVQRERRASIHLLSSDSSENVLFEKGFGEGRDETSSEIDVDLTPWAEQMVLLTLKYDIDRGGKGERGTVGESSVKWKNLRLTGWENSVPEVPDSIRGKYNVIVVVLDALRADYMELYNPEEAKTPRLNRLAADGVMFENASSQAPSTRPSVASLMTSVRATTHRLITKGVESVSPRLAYLPEILHQAGYRTLAVIENANIGEIFGFNRGFDNWHDYYRVRTRKYEQEHPTPQSRSRQVWEDYIEPFLTESKGDPFFAYLHFIDPHSIFAPPSPYDTLYEPRLKLNVADGYNLVKLNGLGVAGVGHTTAQYLKAQYKGEITFMDDLLKDLLARFDRAATSRKTLIVFLSDHGEEFMDHGSFGHGSLLYEEQLHVPLIFSLPGVLPRGSRLRTNVELIDVAPTIMDLLGLERSDRMRGRSLLGLMLAEHENETQALTYARSYSRPFGKRDSARWGRWKILKDYGENHALYDLRRDPGELIDRWSGYPVEGETLRQMLLWQTDIDGKDIEIRASDETSIGELDPETIKNLGALGYLR